MELLRPEVERARAVVSVAKHPSLAKDEGRQGELEAANLRKLAPVCIDRRGLQSIDFSEPILRLAELVHPQAARVG